MDFYALIKILHVIGATVVFGTGAGIAFFMLMAHRSRDPIVIAHTASVVVIADTLFTATAVVVQPVTGAALAWMTGLPLLSGWIGVSLGLYIVAGLCWLPVVWIQIQLRDLARTAVRDGTPLPLAYDRLFRVWFGLGVPAFAAVLGIIALMVVKPSF